MDKPLRTRRGVPTRTADDWEEAALDVIAARGIAGLSIPELAGTLQVTKGSFYWHFSTLDDLVTHSIKRWEANDKATLDQARGIEDPSARLRALFTEAMASERAHGLYIALSLSGSARVAACLRRVNDRRLLFLTDSYRELGLTKEAARQQALLTYSAYIGGVHLRRSGAPLLRDPPDVSAYVEHAARALVDRHKPR